MARRVYFAFHYDEDIWRVNQVRNSNVVAGPDRAGFYDHSEYLEAEKKGDAAIARMIDSKLRRTTVTVVLIGEFTASRRWVRYEIDQSIRQNNGLLGIRIHRLKKPGSILDSFNPLGLGSGLYEALFPPPIPSVPPSVVFPVYEWDYDLERFRREIEAAGARSDHLRMRARLLEMASFVRSRR